MTAARDDRTCVCFVGAEADAWVRHSTETLLAQGYAPHVIAPAAADIPKGVPFHRVERHAAGPSRSASVRAAAFTTRACERLARVIRPYRRRVVEVALDAGGALAVSTAARVLGARVVVRVTRPPARMGGVRRRAAETMQRWAAANADRVVVSSHEMRDWLGERGLDRRRIAVIVQVPPTVAELDRYRYRLADIADEWKQRRREGIFRAVSRCQDGDTAAYVAGAIERVRERVPGACLRVIAPGAGVERVRGSVRDAEWIDFATVDDVGALARALLGSDVGIIYAGTDRRADVIVDDAVFEFAALERPVIAPRIPVLTSLFPDDTLLYYEPGDPADLAERIHQLFAYPEEGLARAARTREVTDAYSWERESKRYVALYRDLVKP